MLSAAVGGNSRQRAGWHGGSVLKGLWNLLLYRVLGGRIMLALAAFGFLRRMLSGRKDADRDPSRPTAYPTSRSRRGL